MIYLASRVGFNFKRLLFPLGKSFAPPEWSGAIDLRFSFAQGAIAFSRLMTRGRRLHFSLSICTYLESVERPQLPEVRFVGNAAVNDHDLPVHDGA